MVAVASSYMEFTLGKTSLLDDICGREAAVDRIADFDLQCRMSDAKAIVEFVRKLIEERVTRMATGHNQVNSHCDRCRAQRPDMEIVDGTYARAVPKPFCDCLPVDGVRHSIER